MLFIDFILKIGNFSKKATRFAGQGTKNQETKRTNNLRDQVPRTTVTRKPTSSDEYAGGAQKA